jgi:hypothetical protein
MRVRRRLPDLRRWKMLTSDERKQIRNFQDELTDLVDRFLKKGMMPEEICLVLGQEMNSDLSARQAELDSRSLEEKT